MNASATRTPDPEIDYNRPINATNTAFALLGVALLALTVWAVLLPSIDPLWYWAAVKLLLAASVGLFLRGLRRRVFFGSRLSLHQSLSFEVVVQIAQWTSPLLPRRAFEAEFVARETGAPLELAQAWLSSRASGLLFMVLLACGALLWALGLAVPGALAGVAALAWLAYSTLDFSRSTASVGETGAARHLASSLAGALTWLAEGLLFAWALAGLLEPWQSLALYLFSTALVELVPVPYGIGIAELPALLGALGGYGPEALAALVLFHLARLLPLAPLGVLYLARYKLELDDLQSRAIVRRIAQSRRPQGGWSEPPGVPGGPWVSIVIPAFNEERRLPAYLDEVRGYLDASDLAAEVLIVDDGSKDGTAAYVQWVMQSDRRVRLVSQPYNQGKGNAVRRGVAEARGRFVLFADADGATPIRELDRLLGTVGAEAEIAIGSRRLESEDTRRERAGLRELMGQVFYTVVNFLAVPGIRDTQCGFKLFRTDVAAELFEGLNESGWAFDVELLYRAQLFGYGIAEVAVSWHEVGGSKVDPVKDAIKMFLAIFRIRRNNSGLLRHRGIAVPPALAGSGGLAIPQSGPALSGEPRP